MHVSNIRPPGSIIIIGFTAVVFMYSENFNEHAESLRKKRETEDADNLQHTIAGLETGYQSRHGLKKDLVGGTARAKRKTMREQIRETLDWLLLHNHQYRLAHQNLMSNIRQAQNYTQTAIDRVANELQVASVELDDLLSRAAKLPDGRAVFNDQNGNVRDEAGDIVPTVLSEAIEWNGVEPTFEEYNAMRKRVDDLNALELELRGIEVELGEIHESANNNDKPLSESEIADQTDRAKTLGERASEIETDVSALMASRLEQPAPSYPNQPNTSLSSLSAIPDLSSGAKR